MMADDLNAGDNGDYMTSRNLKTNDKQGFKFTLALLGFHLKEFAPDFVSALLLRLEFMDWHLQWGNGS